MRKQFSKACPTQAAHIYEALSYYHAEQAEIEENVEESRVERLIERHRLKVATDGRVVTVGSLEP